MRKCRLLTRGRDGGHLVDDGDVTSRAQRPFIFLLLLLRFFFSIAFTFFLIFLSLLQYGTDEQVQSQRHGGIVQSRVARCSGRWQDHHIGTVLHVRLHMRVRHFHR